MGAESVLEAAARHRKALGRQQEQAAQVTARAYAEAWRSTRGDLDRLHRQMAEARRLGSEISEAWLVRQESYRMLLTQVESQLNALAPLVAQTTDALIVEAVAAAASHVTELVQAADPALGRINPRAVTQIAGSLDRGALADLVAARTPQHVAQVKEVLRVSVVRGWSPSKTARELKHVAVDLPATHARRLARTEQMRAYREATRLSYIENPAVTHWVWSCRRSLRSCAYCWAMDGTKHQTREIMATHPNCMCVMVPYVEGIEYGMQGPERFRALTADEQKTILGPSAYAAYAEGRIDITDLVHRHRSKKWGPVGRQGSLAAALDR